MNSHLLNCVVLFDIDGTLITGPETGATAGFKAIITAAEEISGKKIVPDATLFSGRTDLQIAKILLEQSGIKNPTQDQIHDLVQKYVHYMEQNLKTHPPYRVLGDPKGAVHVLKEQGAIIGLGTGNVPKGAELKLKSAGMGDLFDIALGGYGGDGDTRAELIAVGIKRCDPSGQLPVIIVGDTPHDVEAALANHALCVGIPYRNNTADILQKAGAHAVIDQVNDRLAQVIQSLI